jgi:hypothetical protein
MTCKPTAGWQITNRVIEQVHYRHLSEKLHNAVALGVHTPGLALVKGTTDETYGPPPVEL